MSPGRPAVASVRGRAKAAVRGGLGRTDDVGVGRWVGVGVSAVGAPQERRATVGRRPRDGSARRSRRRCSGGGRGRRVAAGRSRRPTGDGVDAATLVALLAGVDRRPATTARPLRAISACSCVRSRAGPSLTGSLSSLSPVIVDRAYLVEHRVHDDERPVGRERERDVAHATRRRTWSARRPPSSPRPVAARPAARRHRDAVLGPRRARPALAPARERAHVARLRAPTRPGRTRCPRQSTEAYRGRRPQSFA